MSETLRLGTSNKRLDPVAVEQGVTRPCPFRPGLTITILPAASFNPRFRRAVQLGAVKAAAKLKSQNGNVETATEEAEDEFLGRYDDPHFIVAALVADMGGLYDGEGNEVEYTTERGLQVFSDPGNADVKEWTVNQSLLYGQFYVEEVQEQRKNSRTGSGGKKAGAGKSEKTTSSGGR